MSIVKRKVDQRSYYNLQRPNKKISVFRVMGLTILGRVDTHVFLDYFFSSGKDIILCILKGEMPFKMHKIIIFAFQNAQNYI